METWLGGELVWAAFLCDHEREGGPGSDVTQRLNRVQVFCVLSKCSSVVRNSPSNQ